MVSFVTVDNGLGVGYKGDIRFSARMIRISNVEIRMARILLTRLHSISLVGNVSVGVAMHGALRYLCVTGYVVRCALRVTRVTAMVSFVTGDICCIVSFEIEISCARCMIRIVNVEISMARILYTSLHISFFVSDCSVCVALNRAL
jgi:hypothetical protein